MDCERERERTVRYFSARTIHCIEYSVLNTVGPWGRLLLLVVGAEKSSRLLQTVVVGSNGPLVIGIRDHRGGSFSPEQYQSNNEQKLILWAYPYGRQSTYW